MQMRELSHARRFIEEVPKFVETLIGNELNLELLSRDMLESKLLWGCLDPADTRRMPEPRANRDRVGPRGWFEFHGEG